MIVTRLCGGLGNQLFQYATGRRLSFARGVELILDLGWYDNFSKLNTKRDYELNKYNIKARLPFANEKAWLRLHQGQILPRVPFLPRRFKHFRESSFDFDPMVLDLPDYTYLNGYWQSYKYFEDIELHLRLELLPKEQLGSQDKLIKKKIIAAQGNAVSLHVRRGDYVDNPIASKNHGLSSLSYYQNAIKKIKSNIRDPHFFVFSDDMGWVIKNIDFSGKVTFINHNHSDNAYQDLRLMSFCNHHIIANSSFSWWGAWLSKRERSSIIIAPAKWFADDRSTNYLTPKDWLRI